jgi:hypothetical protein
MPVTCGVSRGLALAAAIERMVVDDSASKNTKRK